MTNEQVKACRARQVARLAEMMGGDAEGAASLYRRCVRYSLRFMRWGEANCSGDYRKSPIKLKMHQHERELLGNLGKRLNDELAKCGLEFEYPGLYPAIVSIDNHENELELFYY